MNEGDSAGGGQQGLSPAPPAVPDRRSTLSTLPTSASTTSSAVTASNYQFVVSRNQTQSQNTTSGSAVTSNVNTIPLTTATSSTSSTISRFIPISQQQQQPEVVNQSSSSYTTANNSGNVRPSISSLDTPAAKILKLDPSAVKSGPGLASPAITDIKAIKKRLLEHKFSRLKTLKEKYNENVAELYYLQIGGNMMEYPVWRKKPPTQQFINFAKSNRLDGLVTEDSNKSNQQPQSAAANANPTTTTAPTLPQGAEIKIPAIGATPVAVSTTLPAAVVQLSQQGHIPGKPLGGRHGMVFGQIPVPPAVGTSSVPLVPGGKPLVPDAPQNSVTTNASVADKRRSAVSTTATAGAAISSTSASSSSSSTPTPQQLTVGTSIAQTAVGNAAPQKTVGNGVQEFSVKAQQEVYVMQRVAELQREGLWTERRLPKLQEPPRPKAHWDYLLEEMVWLAADFAQERKWKKAAAKKCARMVQKYFQDKANAAQKAEKAQEMHLKRVAAFIAKEVKYFWSNVEKLVEYKHQTKLEEKRKKALDQHLSFIVDQTEKFSQQLVEGMNKAAVDNSTAPSLNSSRISSPKRENLSDDDFRPAEASDDDEETIAKAEEEAADVNEEIAALQKESEMDLDDFLKELPKDYLANRDKIVIETKEDVSEEDEADDEFEANEASSDDENTIMEQEKAEKNVDHKKELDELNADAEMSIDDLMAKYGGKPSSSNRMEVDSDDDEEPETADSDDETEVETADGGSDAELSDENENEDDSEAGLKSLLVDDNTESKESSTDNKDDLLNNAAALAESIQPKGNDLASTVVVTPVPFLLKHSLREYQHVGLDWLVTMHDRKLNGILADEMGLGKTIQTIALLAHLACVKGNWGPHLIVVPSSVMLNWEMEFKKWCPGFKILTYYGTQKERKQKRVGWTKPNAFHVCITSYKLVIQDQQSFRRKKWKYLILDEAQNIKNFKSQRWQLLLNFSTEQRLLLTGTPLQNNLMELWSLMHFLMPHVFQSHREFKEWFSNPVTGMIEGNSEYNESIIKRLHKVLRPFLLRRLKSEVEKQMPKKYEHVVMCRLSKRQRYLYDDFMSRAKTRETLSSGNLLSVINVLMQLRKVCNHPNLFEVRPTISPLQMDRLTIRAPSLVCNVMNYNPFTQIDLNSLNLILVQLEQCVTAYVSYKSRKLSAPRRLIEEIDSLPEPPPRCPSGKYKFHIRVKDGRVQENIVSHTSNVKVGTSPAMKTDGNKLVPVVNLDQKNINKRMNSINVITTKRPHLAEPSSSQSPPVKNPDLVKALAQEVKTTAKLAFNELVSVKMETDEPDVDPEFFSLERIQQRKEQRLANLQTMARVNQRRCDAVPIYGEDCRMALNNFSRPCKSVDLTTWISRSYSNCQTAMSRRDNWTLTTLLKSYEQRTKELDSMFGNFVIFVPPVTAPRPSLHVQHLHPSVLNYDRTREKVLCETMSPKLGLLHPIISAMATQFPDPRLIQYDCGKLQTLNGLLRKLKSEQHRVLIFTQMTKMLDVLEAFLNCHGHIYLRLDGTTKVEQRQILMERFNNDKRIFVFILSTRSGGVGINLTGADTVIFYDSDWNPTMDAQAQDRCHRIGQTRDVHIYRLVSEKTIEENILKKANQKRLLGDLAIEGGNFTTAFFKSSTIQDLFEVRQDGDANSRLAEVVDRDRERRTKLQESLQQAPTASTSSSAVSSEEKASLGAFESALAAAEDEQDVQAAKVAKAEAAADLDEFDENIPLEETDRAHPEMSKADLEVQNLVKQLSPIERYAMRFVEATGEAWTAEQLRAAEEEIEAQKREWEANRLAALQKEEEILKAEAEADVMLTYSREDAKNQIWISDNTMEQMPMWCPPTPPQNDNDIYIDYSLSFMYETDIMPESHLPPVYVKKEYKRSRSEAGFLLDGRRPPKIRKEDNYYAPRSLFDRPSPAISKIRRDLKMQRYRGVFKPNVQIPGLKPQMPIKPLIEPEGMADWTIAEDIAILHVLQNLQGLPLNLMLLSPGHTPNWDLVAEIVNLHSKTYRSPKQCRWRYEAVIVPREEGKLLESPKKLKKLKTAMKASIKGGVKTLRTSQMFTIDNNSSYTKMMKTKFDGLKTAYLKKAPPPKRPFTTPSPMNPKHAEVLQEFGIVSYDNPLAAISIATRKAERLKEKQQRAMAQIPPPPPSLASLAPHSQKELMQSSVVQQIQIQQGQIQQPTQAIVVHQTGQNSGVVQSSQQIHQVTQIMQGGQIQTTRVGQNNIQMHQQQSQIVKAIVTPSSGLVTTAQAQQLQLQQSTGNLVPSSVSVVLTTPVTTLSNVQHQTSQGTQIVSIQTNQIQSSNSMMSQTQTSLVQTIPSQTLPQVVSVSQLATVGTVLTTSAGLQSNATVTTLNASTLRAQRIVGTPSLQEVVLQQRPNSQSPTIVSMTSLGHTVTNSQFQPTQLRLSMAGGQQVSGVMTKGIPVGSIQQTGKMTNQPAQIQLFRQQALRQQLKVMQGTGGQAGQGATVVQTAGGQAIVNASGAIIQGGIMSAGSTVQVQGQKVSVATVSAANVGANTSVATVQVAQGQGRAQFIKQFAAKQALNRQVVDNEMLLVKRQVISQQKQVIPQGQLFASGNVQVQQAGTSGQQQIATLVKTTAANIAGATGTVNMLSQIKPGGQIKVTMANQTQMRQIQLQQQLAMAQQRKVGGKMTQIAQVGQKPGVPAQLIVQNSKNMPGPVTVQQIQQVIRQTPGALNPGAQIVLNKANMARVIPVSVSSQQNQRQTIQVVSAASAQALAAGNIRAHVASGQNISGTIKVATGATPAQTQQALIAAIQSQQSQRQNPSPVRLQTTPSGNLVAVNVQQQAQSSQSGMLTSSADIAGGMQQSQQQQHQTPQQQPQK